MDPRIDRAREIVECEAEAVRQVALRIGPDLAGAADAILALPGRVVTAGMGKAGIIAQKLSATFASTGTPSIYLHPAEAIHGDHIDRWKVWHDERRITFYRLPIVRFLRLQEGEDRDEKLLIESCVFRAVAELLDKDPWELAPGRYRHL